MFIPLLTGSVLYIPGGWPWDFWTINSIIEGNALWCSQSVETGFFQAWKVKPPVIQQTLLLMNHYGWKYDVYDFHNARLHGWDMSRSSLMFQDWKFSGTFFGGLVLFFNRTAFFQQMQGWFFSNPKGIVSWSTSFQSFFQPCLCLALFEHHMSFFQPRALCSGRGGEVPGSFLPWAAHAFLLVRGSSLAARAVNKNKLPHICTLENTLRCIFETRQCAPKWVSLSWFCWNFEKQSDSLCRQSSLART